MVNGECCRSTVTVVVATSRTALGTTLDQGLDTEKNAWLQSLAEQSQVLAPFNESEANAGENVNKIWRSVREY